MPLTPRDLYADPHPYDCPEETGSDLWGVWPGLHDWPDPGAGLQACRRCGVWAYVSEVRAVLCEMYDEHGATPRKVAP